MLPLYLQRCIIQHSGGHLIPTDKPTAERILAFLVEQQQQQQQQDPP